MSIPRRIPPIMDDPVMFGSVFCRNTVIFSCLTKQEWFVEAYLGYYNPAEPFVRSKNSEEFDQQRILNKSAFGAYVTTLSTWCRDRQN